MLRYLSLLAAVLLTSTITGNGAIAAGVPSYIATAVGDGARPDADKQRDANRKPAETLEFAGVKPGEQIAEYLPGGGYFTRIFSKAVGANGQVYALVPGRAAKAPADMPAKAPADMPAKAPADMPDMAARVKAIASDVNYPNVTVIAAPFAKLAAPVPVDMAWISQNYHDLHNFPGVDVPAFNKMVFDSLKPGGTYIVLDHAAAAGSGARDTGTLHRIDPETVKAEVLAAGFVLVSTSDLLKQTADDHTARVIDPAVRGKTDQFILKFRKPAKN
ncbi:MAG: methyltransferase [Pseudomonadota bacterium]|nr:methyltransferase [Pseudomonadota bacterium]